MRKWYESSRVVLALRCTLAEPSLWKKHFGGVKVARIAVDAVGMKEDLRLLRDHPTHRPQWISQNLLMVINVSTHKLPSTLAPFPLFTERCEPLGTGGWRRSASLLLEREK